MARNEEKAQSMLNRWLRVKAGQTGEDKRPFLASEVTNIAEAERWRQQILREIKRDINAIQNAALGEHQIRDLNDHINKLIREKYHYERQIASLGGRDYRTLGRRITDADGKAIVGEGGYMYFGAARELPGVRDMLQKQQAPKPQKRSRVELYEAVDMAYFGYMDEDDGQLVRVEREAEKIAIMKALTEYEEQTGIQVEEIDLDHYLDAMNAIDTPAPVKLPSPIQIEQAVLQQRKKALLAKYT